MGFQETRFFINIKILGRYVRALVDTGTILSYIDEETEHRILQHGVLPIFEKRDITVIDRTKTETNKIYPLSVRFNNIETPLNVAPIPSLTVSVILGIDFLIKREIEIKLDGIPIKHNKIIAYNNGYDTFAHIDRVIKHPNGLRRWMAWYKQKRIEIKLVSKTWARIRCHGMTKIVPVKDRDDEDNRDDNRRDQYELCVNQELC